MVSRCCVPAVVLLCVAAPAPAAETQTAVEQIVASERAFAARAQLINARLAFAEFFAPDAVLFVPFPAPAFPRLLEGADWPVNIQWRPVAAAASGAGDMGYTTGPAEYRRDPAEAPTGFAHYTSVWQRQPDGRYLVRVDIGIDHGPLSGREPDWTPPAAQMPDAPVLDVATRAVAMRELEAVEARCGGGPAAARAQALLDVLDEDVRWQHAGALPVVGRARAVEAVAASGSDLEWTPEATVVAASGDFGFSYGRGRSAAGTLSGEFTYLNVWQRRNGAWSLLTHVARPARTAN